MRTHLGKLRVLIFAHLVANVEVKRHRDDAEAREDEENDDEWR